MPARSNSFAARHKNGEARTPLAARHFYIVEQFNSRASRRALGARLPYIYALAHLRF